jgi:hypothetical protein
MRIQTEKVLFGGRPTPGIAFVEPITIEASYETREVVNRAGRNYVYKGLEPVSTTITCTLYDDQDLADAREFIQFVRPSIDSSSTVTTWDVQHPSLGGINEFVIKSITYPRPLKDTSYVLVIKVEEFRAPEPVLKKLGGDGSKIGPYDAVTATGESGDTSQTDLAAAERAARLDAADRELEAKKKQDELTGWTP